jgi:hypothetical protein
LIDATRTDNNGARSLAFLYRANVTYENGVVVDEGMDDGEFNNCNCAIRMLDTAADGVFGESEMDRLTVVVVVDLDNLSRCHGDSNGSNNTGALGSTSLSSY